MARGRARALRLLDRPGLILLAGGSLTGILAVISLLRAGDFANQYVVTSAGTAALAMAVLARRHGPHVLHYGALSVSIAFTGLGMVVMGSAGSIGPSASVLGANSLFLVGVGISMAVIVPALYRRLDGRTMTTSALDGAIMLFAGTTLMLTVWRTSQGVTGMDRLFIPLAASALFASAGVAAIAALALRAAPTFRGIWSGIVGVSVMGLSWIVWIDLVSRGQPRNMQTSLLYSGGILIIGYAWMTWNDDAGGGRKYDRVAGILGDWLPIVAMATCVLVGAIPHGRIGGIDPAPFGTIAVVLLSIARQRVLIVHERAVTLRLTGEERLRAEKDAAEAANRAKSAFLAMMSHEIRTPMNAILGNAGLLGDAELAPSERESVDAILTAGQTLLSLINDVLDFSKIEADRMELERVGFAPANLVDSVVSMFSVTAATKGLTMTTDIDPSIPVILAGDPLRLRQVLTNLVGNAVKFTAEGEVRVLARVEERNVSETVLRIEVSDTGVGIDEDGRARLFAPFAQVDASTTRKFGGTGLGLAISKKLVGLMDGEIGVESVPCSGSTFWFTVRLAAPSDREAGTVLAANENSNRTAEVVGAHVLVAEDNPANKRLIERLLDRIGVEVTVVSNGLEAVEAVRSGLYDLVLMDCHMPEMDGLDATRAIRAGGFATPIVALTANAMIGDRDACIAAGMNDYLSKPVVAAELAAAIQLWLPRDRTAGLAAAVGFARARVDVNGGLIDAGQIGELQALDPDGSAGFLAAMVDSYEGTAAETVPQIRAALASGDPLALEDAAHKFKGVAANLGVRLVHDATARLVALARSGTTAGGDPIFVELEAALAPASAALQELLAGAEAPAARAERGAEAAAGAGDQDETGTQAGTEAEPSADLDLDLLDGHSPGAGRVAAR